MNQIINFQNKNISYSIQGSGVSLVFLHGYLEYKEIWSDFIKYFIPSYQVLCIDLPGHGASQSVDSVHTMKQMAEIVKLILDRNGIKKTFIVGHSMGGYVALSFANYFSKSLYALILFSSSSLNDSTEKKLARNRDINLIKEGKKEMVIDNNIPNMFASNNLVRFDALIDEIKNKVKKMSDAAIIASLEGMKQRLNYKTLLQSPPVPLLFVAGALDNLIQIDVSERQIKDTTNVVFKVLTHSGHMGYLEEEEFSKNIVLDFFMNIRLKEMLLLIDYYCNNPYIL